MRISEWVIHAVGLYVCKHASNMVIQVCAMTWFHQSLSKTLKVSLSVAQTNHDGRAELCYVCDMLYFVNLLNLFFT